MNKVTLWLTRLWLRLMRAKLVDAPLIRLDDESEERIIIFSSKSFFVLGQVTPFGTTIVHELVFRSKSLLNYVVAHESGHKRQWYRYLLYPLVLLWLPGALLMLLFLVMLLYAMVSLSLTELLVSAQALGLSLLLFATPCLFSWVLELHADCYAIRKLGIKKVLHAIRDAQQLAKTYALEKPGLLTRVIGRITHPPIPLTFRICRFFSRDKGSG